MVIVNKRFFKRKYIFIIFFVIVCLGLLIWVRNNIIYGGGNIKAKLVNLGYNEADAKALIKKIPISNYKLVIKYDESLVDLVNSKDYNPKFFSKYFHYYSKNKSSNIQSIVTIVNSGFDLMDYPASDLLSELVGEKYYINKNVARYLDYGNKNKISAKKIISIVNSNADLDFYSKDKSSNLKDDNLVLVNKFYHLPNDYVPSDLVSLSSEYNIGNNNEMRKEAAQAFMKMVDGALLDNIILKNASAYRSYDYQANLYDSYAERDGKDEADIYSARAGYSEHQTGLCSDINIIDSSFDNTSEAKWLRKNAYKYGFILRFPKDKEEITGYKYESWHYRYVGKKAAKIIFDDDLTLEEYYAYYVLK